MHSWARCVLAVAITCVAILSAEAGDKAAQIPRKIDAAAMQALRSKIGGCWSIPDSPNLPSLNVALVVQLQPDGSLSGKPTIQNPQKGKEFQSFAASAIRAIEKCAPYTMLRPYPHEIWSEIILTFNLGDITPPRPQQ